MTAYLDEIMFWIVLVIVSVLVALVERRKWRSRVAMLEEES